MQLENAKGQRVNLQAGGGAVVTRSDTNDLEKVANGFRLENVTAGETLTVVFTDDTTLQLTLSDLDAGYHPVGPIKRFNSTGSSGSYKIIALW